MRIYLDHNATTPLDPLVADRMAQAMRDVWGNASSVHHFGQQAKAALDEARGAVGALIGADASEIVFTAGGTESDNLAIRGAAEAIEPSGRKHLVTSAIEHEAVLNTMKALARRGWRVTLVPVDASGIVSIDRMREAITDDTALVSVMHANNEIGTIQPIAEIAADRARARRAVSHRRGAERRQDSDRRARARRRHAHDRGTQVLRTEGHRRAVDEARRSPGVAHDRRQAGTKPPRRAPRTCRRSSASASPRSSRSRRWPPKRRG